MIGSNRRIERAPESEFVWIADFRGLRQSMLSSDELGKRVRIQASRSMSRSVRSRLRLFIGVLGCAVLVASFLSWAHTLHAGAAQHTWVEIDRSQVPPAETAELWHVSATCIRPYFVRALMRSKTRLAAHYNAAPAEVRARLTPGTAPGQSLKPAAWHPRPIGGQNETGRRNPYGEYDAALQVKYAEWYAALFKLEIAANTWQQRLIEVADQTVVVGAAARAGFAAYSRGDISLSGAQGDFDDYLLTALGLGGFSSAEQVTLKGACVTINPVMARLYDARLLGAIWRWPLDCLAEFSFGLELVLISIFFAPIAVWLGTGGLEVTPYMRTLTYRLGTSIRDFRESKLVCRMLERFRDISAANLASLNRTKSHAAGRRAGDAMTWTAEPKRGGQRLRPLGSDRR
jgi:hypothetical protein